MVRLARALPPLLYVGLPALALVLAGLPGGLRSGWVWALLGLAALSLLFALGRHAPVYDALQAVVPPLRSLRYPVKAIVLASFCLALVGGHGFDAWHRREGSDRRWTLLSVTLLVLAMTALGAGWVLAARSADWGSALLAGDPSTHAGLLAPARRSLLICGSLAAVTALLAVLARFRWRTPVLSIAVATLALLDLALAQRGLNPTAPAGTLTGTPPVIAAARPAPHQRTFVFDYARGRSAERLLGHRAFVTVLRPEGSRPWDGELALRMYGHPTLLGLWGREGSYGVDAMKLLSHDVNTVNALVEVNEASPALMHRLLRMGAVDPVIAMHAQGFEELRPAAVLPSSFPEPILVFRVPDPLPRAYAVGRARVAPPGQGWRALIANDFDPGREIVLPEGPVLESDSAVGIRPHRRDAARPRHAGGRSRTPRLRRPGGRLRLGMEGDDRRSRGAPPARQRSVPCRRSTRRPPPDPIHLSARVRPRRPRGFGVCRGLPARRLARRRRARAAVGEPLNPRRRLPAGLLLTLVLALEAVVLLSPATIGGEAFFRRDVHLMWAAQAEAYAQAWRDGSWPLWSSRISFGQPLLADANTQVLYPATLLHLVLPPWTYYTVYAVLHLVLAGLGASLLARVLGLGRTASAAAGALWMASGPLLSVIDTWNQLAGAAWMPWSIAAGLRALSGGGARWALAWAGFSALQILSGSPEAVLLSWAGVAVVALAAAGRDQWSFPRVARAGGCAAAAALLALGLSAAQWWPALDAARAAGRTRLPWEARTHWSVHPANLGQAVCPLPLHRMALDAHVRQALFGAPDPFLPSIYLGAVGAALVTAALTRRSRHTAGLAAVGLLSVLIALGRYTPFYDVLVRIAPPLQAFRYPAKALLLTSLAWCLLCGFGLAALGEWRRRWPPAAVAAFLAVTSSAAAALFAWGNHAWLDGFLADSEAAELGPLAVRLALAGLLAAIAAVVLYRGGPSSVTVLGALAMLDLAAAHHDLNPTAPVALFTHTPAAVATARDPAGGRLFTFDYLEPGASLRDLGRSVPYLLARAPVGWDLRAAQALALREALFPPSASAWGVEGSYDRDVPALEPTPIALLKETFRRTESPEARLRLLRVAAVSRVAALHEGAGAGLRPLGRYEGYFVDPVLTFEVPASLPRTFVVGRARVLPDPAALATLASPDFDPTAEVILTRGPAGAPPSSFAGTSVLRERRADRIRLDVETSAPGWAVVVDAWDPGWRARVDGRPAEVERANVAFRAVAVPAGRHEVELVFRPSAVAPALWTSAASLAALVAAAAIARAPRKEPSA